MPTAPTPTTPTSRASRTHRDALANLAIALGGVWTGVTAISLLSPDMVSGSEQQHLPIAAFTSWIWGTIASGTVVAFWARSHRRAGGEGMQRPMASVSLIRAYPDVGATADRGCCAGSHHGRCPPHLGGATLPVKERNMTTCAINDDHLWQAS